MSKPFGEEFNSYLSASRDYDCYLSSKGYIEDNGRYYWQPQDPTDFDSLEAPNYGPGAMRQGEIDDNYDPSLSEEF